MLLNSLIEIKKQKSPAKKLGFQINELSNSMLIEKNKDISLYKILLKISPVNCYLFGKDKISEIFETIKSILNTFEENRFAIYIMNEKINLEENIKYLKTIERRLTNNVKNILLNEQIQYLDELSNKDKNTLNFYISIEYKCKIDEEAINYFANLEQVIKNHFLSIQMNCQRLKNNELKELLYKKMNPHTHFLQPFKRYFEIENLFPDSIEEKNNYIEADDMKYRYFTIFSYPNEVNEYLWLKRLFDIKNIDVSITCTTKDRRKVFTELSKSISEIDARASIEKSEARKKKLYKELNTASNLLDELSDSNTNIYDTLLLITCYNKDLNMLNDICDTVKSVLSSMYMQCCEIKHEKNKCYVTSLPILSNNELTKDYTWNFTTSDIASIIPFDSSEYMDVKGILVGENSISSGTILVDYRSKNYNNSHLCVLAESGAGKTFFLKTDIIRNMPFTDYQIIFDVKGNDITFPRHWGTRYEFSTKSNVIINPFHIDDTIELNEKILDLMSFFKWIIDNMSSYHLFVLEEDIRESYNLKAIPTINDFYNVIDNKINKSKSIKEIEAREYIRDCIKPYTHGVYSKIFNGQNTWEIQPLTIFDIGNVPEMVKKPLYDILLKYVWTFCKKDGTKNPKLKDIYIDEAHQFADPKNPQTFEFLSTHLIKEGRGFGVRCITATQNLPDFLSIPRLGQAIIDNSYFKFFMRLGASDIKPAQDLYDFSPNEIKILKGVGSKAEKGKGIFMIGSQKLLLQIKASDNELEIIDPIQYEEKINNEVI